MIEWLQKALGRVPARDTAGAFAAHAAGDWARAVALLQPLAQQHPDDADIALRLGDALCRLDRFLDALPFLERTVRLAPGVAAHHYKLGNVLMDLERLDEALAAYRRAIELEPRHAQALANTGAILEIRGNADDAVEYYRRALKADPTLRPAHRNLATLLHRTNRFPEAIDAYRAWLQQEAGAAEGWWNLAAVYEALERYEGAIAAYEEAMALDPDFTVAIPAGPDAGLGKAELLNRIGTAYRLKRAFEPALRCFDRAIEHAPRHLDARLNRAGIQHNLGLLADSIPGFREILEIAPGHPHAGRILLMELLYTPASADALFEEHLAYARRLAPPSPPPLPAPAIVRSREKLRIGYVSSDFRVHAVGYNLQPVIEHHDRDAFELFLYSIVRKPDAMTRWFKEQAAWRPIGPMADEDAAQLIRRDEVDILVLLAGRFDENRPQLARYRSAPVQVSMHDPATSGLAEMDYLIADRNLVPRHTTERFTERVACLPTFYLHPAIDEAPVIPLPPCARNGYVTFGSFNNPPKINEAVVAAWARLLHAVPGSKLLLKYMDIFTVPTVRARYLSLFRAHGIGEERIVIPREGAESRQRHFARYAEMDIALDPFPFTGSTTTFEALWMGVPVVTLAGERMVARWSTAMLRKVGLDHLIAGNDDQYVEIARKLAADPGELARLRTSLRERVARSPLCAAEARTRQLERLYRRMWAIHAAGRPAHA